MLWRGVEFGRCRSCLPLIARFIHQALCPSNLCAQQAATPIGTLFAVWNAPHALSLSSCVSPHHGAMTLSKCNARPAGESANLRGCFLARLAAADEQLPLSHAPGLTAPASANWVEVHGAAGGCGSSDHIHIWYRTPYMVYTPCAQVLTHRARSRAQRLFATTCSPHRRSSAS